MKTCKNCGAECRDEAIFCDRCGSRFETAEETLDENAEKEPAVDGLIASGTGTGTGSTGTTEEETRDGEAIFDVGAVKEEDFRETRKKKILDTVTSPLFITLCVAELMALLSGIFINLTATPGSTVTIPLLSIFVCLCVWMIFLSAKNRGVVPEGWVKALRVLTIILKVCAWIVFGCTAAAAIILGFVPSSMYSQIWTAVVEELEGMGLYLPFDIEGSVAALGLSLKVAAVAGCAVVCAFSAIIAVFFGKLRNFLECVEKEARGDLPGMYPSSVAGFCWFYVIISALGFCFYLMIPPYNIFTVISYAADIVCAISVALIVNRIAND